MQLSQNAITPAVVGKLLGMSAEIVRRRMEDGTLPIGLVERRVKNNSYLIFPKMLYDVTGIRVQDYEPPAVIQTEIDYEKLARCIVSEMAGLRKEAT